MIRVEISPVSETRGFLRRRDGGLMKFPNVALQDGPMPYADVGAALEASMVSYAADASSLRVSGRQC